MPRPNVTIHDLRHTLGVHCVQAGVPIVRLQKLLGHASPHMTVRYMKHAQESYFTEDAAKVAGGYQRGAEPGSGGTGGTGPQRCPPDMTNASLRPHIFPHSGRGGGGSERGGAGLPKRLCARKFQRSGVVAEWLNAAVLKTAERETVP